MHRIDSLFFTIIQFVSLIDSTKQSQFRQAILLLKTIGNTIKNPMVKTFDKTIKVSPMLKTIGNNIKKSMGMFQRNKNQIKNTNGLQEKYLRSSHNVGKKSIEYLVKEETTKSIPPLKQLRESELKKLVKGSNGKLKDKEFKALIDKTVFRMGKEELRSMLIKSTNYMEGKELRHIVDKIAGNNKMLPYLFVTGFFSNIINYDEDDNFFKPNITPKQIFEAGAFGGTYWRPIEHKGVVLKDQHKKYNWDIPDEVMTKPWDEYDPKVNKYNIESGTTLEYWREKNWITDWDPYGWGQWYCNYHEGRRCEDDERQIVRHNNLAGPNGRFRKLLVKLILNRGAKWDDYSINPKLRQTLLHWGYELTKKDFDYEVNRINFQ